MAEQITSRENDRVKYARRLVASGTFRAQEGLFFAEGLRLCLDLAETMVPLEVYYTKEMQQSHPEVREMAGRHYLVDGSVAQKLAETRTPQGLFCLFPMPKAGLESLALEEGVLVCEKLQDPANVGAVLRSAAAFGYAGAILVQSADPFSPKALRASMGAVGRMPVVREESIEKVVAYLREKKLCLYAAAGADSVPLGALEVSAPFALLVGNEGTGLSKTALQAAHRRVGIPMQKGVESLNVAVAASVLMYRMRENRM
ncbi:RNA methyltransferase [Ruminococcaceae bacterium OttesenSCG-928-I18]|nr:RNA methyltransferase [Ruminococcaceae bacterium OttesenSCG-928-I18]